MKYFDAFVLYFFPEYHHGADFFFYIYKIVFIIQLILPLSYKFRSSGWLFQQNQSDLRDSLRLLYRSVMPCHVWWTTVCIQWPVEIACRSELDFSDALTFKQTDCL